jgi:hypothetical protein
MAFGTLFGALVTGIRWSRNNHGWKNKAKQQNQRTDQKQSPNRADPEGNNH